jgi:hypothetical protein
MAIPDAVHRLLLLLWFGVLQSCSAADVARPRHARIRVWQASFWQIQLDVLDKQIVEAQERRAAEHGERDIT